MDNQGAIKYMKHVYLDVCAISKPLLSHYPVSGFAYMEYLSPSEYFHISTMTQWSEHYLTISSHGASLSQVLKECSFGNQMTSLAWAILNPTDPIEIFANHLGIRFGFNVYQWSGEKLRLWSFAGEDLNSLLFFQSEKELIEQFIFYFNHVGQDLITPERVKKNTALWQTPLDFGGCPVSLSPSSKTNPFGASHVSLQGHDKMHKFTHHQWQILKLYSQGVSQKDIGRRFGISHRTIEHTLKIIREKTGLLTRGELLGLIQQNQITCPSGHLGDS